MNYMNQPRGNCPSQCGNPAANNRQGMDSGCRGSNGSGSRCGGGSMNSRCGNMTARYNDCDANSSSRNDPLEGMPIAIGYVPWQQWRKTYDYCEGLSQGTIFPCLNLPFYGCIPRDFRCNKGGRA